MSAESGRGKNGFKSFSVNYKLSREFLTSLRAKRSGTSSVFMIPFEPVIMSAATALCRSPENSSSNVDVRMRNNSTRPDGGGGGSPLESSAVGLPRPHSASPSMSPPSSPGQSAGRPSRCCFCCCLRALVKIDGSLDSTPGFDRLTSALSACWSTGRAIWVLPSTNPQRLGTTTANSLKENSMELIDFILNKPSLCLPLFTAAAPSGRDPVNSNLALLVGINRCDTGFD
ncbi:hypothetical protein RRG08_029593 [Elysia crispata]|uniref:Uncharacterized protein n=1 Tax=Elysia crispata TaxID=231223 RepID=A0AAE1CJL0_9GAST|nr:hypothetical protein RRG08_029593 [Elysia crispata]